MTNEMDWLRDSIGKVKQDKRNAEEDKLKAERIIQDSEQLRLEDVEKYRLAAQPHAETAGAFIVRVKETTLAELEEIQLTLSGPNFEEWSLGGPDLSENLREIYRSTNSLARRRMRSARSQPTRYYVHGFRWAIWEFKGSNYTGHDIEGLVINLLLDENSQPFYYIVRVAADEKSPQNSGPILASLQDKEAKSMIMEWAGALANK